MSTPDAAPLSREAKQLLCVNGYGGRMEYGKSNAWNLDFGAVVAADLESDDESSIASNGSQITIEENSIHTNFATITTSGATITPSSPHVPVRTIDFALEETPPEARKLTRKPPSDCHVLVRWSQLVQFLQSSFICKCGKPIVQLERRTIGIATEIDFCCRSCHNKGAVLADRRNHVEDNAESNFIRRERRVDSYEMNWRLVMATQLMGESQVGGSIISMFLDLSREAFRNSWSPMEDLLGVEQREIGRQCCNLNLMKETMGREGVLTADGTVKYPIHVSYDMGWQKSAKTYDSLTGHGLMIGNRTKAVVAYQNYSKACGACEIHSKKMQKDKTPDLPAPSHLCPKNHTGSSKGMEAKAALDCVNKVWTHDEIAAFIELICIDDDASTKAYLCHSFFELDSKNIPRPKNKKGEPKTGKKNDKGQLWKDHPIIVFLADLSHRVRTFAKYLYALKTLGVGKSEMNAIDCLRLKRNYAWWLFTGTKLTFEEFRNQAKSPILHHFNDHSQCGTWCQHTKKSKDELRKLKKYRCKERNAKLYLQCDEIMERFCSEERLRECHHQMSSQKNEAMNRSIMRYAPKDKTYGRTMALTSRINIAIGIDCVGHPEYYERLFKAMHFGITELTYSGLRRMWRKKEYGRMYSGLKSVKLRRRLKARTKMIEGVAKMEVDLEEGRCYSTGIVLENEDDQQGEPPARKKGRRNNPLTNAKQVCKCGGEDHQRVSSKNCPWKGWSKKMISENYGKRMKDMRLMTAEIDTAEESTKSTTENVQSTGK
jgi:hypothetical protein